MLEFAEVFDEYPNPFYIIKPIVVDGIPEDLEYIYVNKAFCIFLGLSPEELIGHRFLEYYEKGERTWLNLFADAAIGRKHVYVENVSSIISKMMYTEVFHINPDLCGCIIHDFRNVSDDMKSKENEELWHKANYDCLTGFYNRFYLNELYDDISQKEKIGITFLDINNLKVTNDTLGHAAGDELIVRISDMIRSYYKDSLIFRVGGDEFVIITIGYDKERFLRLSEESMAAFENGNLAAVGYCFYEKVENLKECINQCDALMYEQKKRMKKMHQ